MEYSTGVEMPKNIEQDTSSSELVAVARLLVENIRVYGNHVAAAESGPYDLEQYDEMIKEFIERFYELAAPQLPRWVIDRRLGITEPDVSADTLLSAIDAELASWQKGGLVTSQVAPLEDLTGWLYAQHVADTLDAVDDEVVARVLARNTVRVGLALKNY